MLDFSCEYKSKHHTFKFDKDLNFFIDGVPAKVFQTNFSARDGKQLFEALEAAPQKNMPDMSKNLFKTKFEQLVPAIKQIELFRAILKELRTQNTMNWKTSAKFKDEINRFVNDWFYKKEHDYRKNYTAQQKLTLYHITDKVLYYNVNDGDLSEGYDPVSHSKTGVERIYKAYKNFPYNKYCDVHEKIQDHLKDCYDSALEQIKGYEAIVNEAGDDLLDWSQHKISRYINSNKLTGSYWSYSDWISKKRTSLRKKGIKPTSVTKPKKPSRYERLCEKINKEEKLTQEEWFTVFKQARDTEALDTISEFDWPTLCEVMGSNLKVVDQKLSNSNIKKKVFEQAQKIMPESKTNFEILRTFAGRYSLYEEYTWEYISKNLKFCDYEFLLKLADRRYSSMEGASQEVFDILIEKSDIETVLNTCTDLTKEYVRRLDEEDKISILKILLGHTLDGDNLDKNSLMFILTDKPWDKVQHTYFDMEDFEELYKDVPWDQIRGLIRDSKCTHEATNLILKNKDVELARYFVEEKIEEFDTDKALLIMELAGHRSRCKRMLEAMTNGNKNYQLLESIKKFWTTQEDLIKLFRLSLLRSKSNEIQEEIIQIARKRKYDKDAFRKVILSLTEEDYPKVTLTENYFWLLDKTTKLHLLKINAQIEEAKYSSYSYRTTGLDSQIEQFFSNLNREDLLTVYESIPNSRFRNYLSRQMTLEERKECCEHDSHFLRVNLDDIPYEYLKKYEDNKAFKELVGDQRDRSNKRFAQSLQERFEKKLKHKINPPNSVKMMFAS